MSRGKTLCAMVAGDAVDYALMQKMVRHPDDDYSVLTRAILYVPGMLVANNQARRLTRYVGLRYPS